MDRVISLDLNAIRAQLLAERASTLGTSLSKLDVLEPQLNVSTDDQAHVLHEQAVALHCHSQELKKLREITSALNRLRTGTFGSCQECEKPISSRRLVAIPWADHCVRCQEHLQRKCRTQQHV